MQTHPLRRYARKHSLTLSQIADISGISRMTLHRVLKGENTTLSLLRRISAATEGAVSVAQLAAHTDEGRAA